MRTAVVVPALVWLTNYGELVAHAHILLIGFVLSFVYGVGLFLVYGGIVSEPTMGPILGTGAVCVLLAMLLMLHMVIRFGSGVRAA